MVLGIGRFPEVFATSRLIGIRTIAVRTVFFAAGPTRADPATLYTMFGVFVDRPFGPYIR